jgi:hypothetical protein
MHEMPTLSDIIPRFTSRAASHQGIRDPRLPDRHTGDFEILIAVFD